jgi:hypothetical protein
MVGTVADGALLATDTAAIPGFHGTQSFDAAAGPLTFGAEVEYAVYAPGQFHSSTALGGPTDPSGGTQYVYAYQLINDGSAAQRTIGELSVGFDGNASPGNLGVIGGAPFGLNPSSSAFVPVSPPFASATWIYNTELTSTQASNILLFTSPNAPHLYNASVLGGGLVDQRQLPSPIPEPSSVLIIGGMIIMLGRSARRSFLGQ